MQNQVNPNIWVGGNCGISLCLDMGQLNAYFKYGDIIVILLVLSLVFRSKWIKITAKCLIMDIEFVDLLVHPVGGEKME